MTKKSLNGIVPGQKKITFENPMRILAFVFLLLILLPATSNSQDKKPATSELRTSNGGYVNLNLNLHSADFPELPGIPNCCERFQSGFGTGFSLGLLYEFPIAKSLLIGFRAGYSVLDAELTEIEKTKVIRNGRASDGEFEHSIDAQLSNIGIESMLGWRVANRLTLYGGFRMGVVRAPTYSQAEQIIKPASGATFLDSNGVDTEKRTRNEFSGDLPDPSGMYVAVLAGVGYELPLNKSNTLRLAPELFYSLGLTNVVNSLDWQANSLKLGLAIKYSPLPVPPISEEHRTIRIIDTIIIDTIIIDTIIIESDFIAEKTYRQGAPITSITSSEIGNTRIITENVSITDTIFIKKKNEFTAEIELYGVDSTGKEIKNPVFRIEEFISSRQQPLLNYIFFEENSSVIPGRYIKLNKSDTADFNIGRLYYNRTLPTYYNALNIIGKRMRNHPRARLTLIGCNDGQATERNNKVLSKNRAESIRNYLSSVWGIGGRRMKVIAANLPQKASVPEEEPDKSAENRRVEISSNVYEILAPVFASDTFRVATPAIARFRIYANSGAVVKMAVINASQVSQGISNNFDTTITVDFPEFVDWNLSQNQLLTPRFDESISYSFTVLDSSGREKITEKRSLPIDLISIRKKRQEKIEDKIIDRYSMILFDFDKSDIAGINNKIIDFIKSRINADSEISISGYTDRTGDDEHNRILSLRRAQVTAAAINRTDAGVRGVGSSRLLYDNDLPEGRFYCRTVDIVVETKVE